ncbi:TonB-dependent receptor [Brevundimonas sp.]|uniref:TonB-dependent receptor n=1 Tax=Brevundimonas sp. TaxID=1871086 RepID=UPI00356A5FDA
MMNRKRAFWATTALFTGLLVAGTASAQSSGTVATEATELDSVTVTGSRGPATTDGSIIAETIAKTRSTITQEFISTQSPGQSILQSLNLVPGLTFTNADPFGNSGGSLRLRGFDGNRISLTFDGVPLNDTGNYAIFSNQQLDPELIERASVNQGSTDVDSPTASATGGTINYSVARPLEEAGIQVGAAVGDFEYGRFFIKADTGAFGPWGTTAYATYSYTNYNKFKGPGELQKQQVNGRLFQNMGDGDFASLSYNFNRNRNAFYNNFINQAQFASGNFLENDQACFRPTGVNGTAQNELTQSTRVLSDGSILAGSCTNYFALRNNPSNTGNIRGAFSYGITDNLRFTFDPSYQFVMATGGGFTAMSERDDRLDLGGLIGTDINRDGDTLDTVTTYTPSLTNTNRYGVLSSLIWDANDDHRFRVAYSYDYGRHRQTGEAIRTDRFANPLNVFGGSKNWGLPGERIFAFNGQSFFRTRDRASIAELNQISAEWRGQFLDDSLTIQLGARAPYFRRELNQNCFSQNGSSAVLCTAQTPNAPLANGNVTFGVSATQFIAPYQAELEYDAVLPSGGVTWRFAESQTVYVSYAESLSAPRTDNLYQPVRNASNQIDFSEVQPETTKAYDLGYRFNNGDIIASAAVWYNQYSNRIVSSFDADPASPFFGQSIDRNVGEVELMGFDGAIGWQASDRLSLYVSAAYNESEIKDDLRLGNFSCTTASQRPGSIPACPVAPASLLIPTFLPTAGKELVETPDWTFAARADYDVSENLSVGLQAKYVGERFSTDVNDEIFDAYTVVDFDARYDLTEALNIKDAFVQLNVTNLLEEEYQANISTGTNALAVAQSADPRVTNRSGTVRTASVGAPRTWLISIGTRF